MPAVTKKRQEIPHNSITKLSTVGFFSAFALALISTVWSLYIDSFVHDMAKVGFITSFFAVISFFAHFIIIPLIQKNEKSKLYIYSVLFCIISYASFSFINNLWVFIIVALVLMFAGAIRLSTFGIIVKDSSTKKDLPKNEGIMYTFLNIAFLVGPLVAGFIAASLGIKYVFVFSAALFLIALIIFKTFNIRDGNISKKVDGNHLKNFFEFFKNKDRTVAYFIYGGVQLWWSFIYGFIPLFIVREGLTDSWVGYFLFAIAIPLISLEYMFAKKAKKIGFKNMFALGFLIAAILGVVCFFLTNIFTILIVLVCASIGMALIEPTVEAYFFSVLKAGEDNRFYSPYHTTIDVNLFVGKIAAAILLLFLPFKFLFLLFPLFMFILFLVSFKAKK